MIPAAELAAAAPGVGWLPGSRDTSRKRACVRKGVSRLLCWWLCPAAAGIGRADTLCRHTLLLLFAQALPLHLLQYKPASILHFQFYHVVLAQPTVGILVRQREQGSSGAFLHDMVAWSAPPPPKFSKGIHPGQLWAISHHKREAPRPRAPPG
jgi:hypothetical protein